MLNALFLQLTVPTAPSDDWRADAESADPVQEVNTLFPFLFPFVSILIIFVGIISHAVQVVNAQHFIIQRGIPFMQKRV